MEAILMKKLITAAAAAAFILGTGMAMAEDTNPKSPTEKTPTQQQMDTKAAGGAKTQAAPAATTGAGMNATKGSSTLPGKPTDNAKDSIQK
jgi:hypothetical protein